MQPIHGWKMNFRYEMVAVWPILQCNVRAELRQKRVVVFGSLARHELCRDKVNMHYTLHKQKHPAEEIIVHKICRACRISRLDTMQLQFLRIAA